MDKINTADVAKKYNSLDVIWHESDKWHSVVKRNIDRFISSVINDIQDIAKYKILNAGSGGNNYNIPEKNILHIDIAETKLKGLPNAIVADVQNIPLNGNQFDLTICVGSVINYCDPIIVLKEFERLSKSGGYLILEFENSYTLELIGKASFNKRAVLVKTFYNGDSENLWFFSESYILELAHLSGYRLLSSKRFHIISPLIYRITKNDRLASKFAKLDKICRYIPLLNKFSSNTIFLLVKN
jgi:SAM-dependent methyltransferase